MTNAWNAAILWRNLADAGTLTASAEEPAMPATLLLNPHIGRHWRAMGTSAWVVVDLGSVRSLDTVALFGLNLTAVGTVRVRLSASDPAGVTGIVHDSDFPSASGTVLIGGTAPPGSTVEMTVDATDVVDQAFGSAVLTSWVYPLPAPVSARYVRIDLTDASLGWIEAGRIVVGLRTQFGVNFDYGWSRGRVDRSRQSESRGGQRHIDPDNSYRTVTLTFSALAAGEAETFDTVDLEAGTHADVLLITDPTAADLPAASIWGLLDSLDPIANPYFATFSRSIKINERL